MLAPSMQGEGVGVCTFANGDCYQGSLVEGVPQGLGLYHFTANGKYAGQVSCLACMPANRCAGNEHHIVETCAEYRVLLHH